MIKKLSFHLEKINSENDKYLIETELDILSGVKDANLNWKTGECWVEFDDSKIVKDKIIKKVNSLGYKSIKSNNSEVPGIQEHVYFVEGMHCASCELITEKKLLQKTGIKAVEASVDKRKVIIKHINTCPTPKALDDLFKEDGYTFSNEPIKDQSRKSSLNINSSNQLVINKRKLNDLLIIIGSSIALVIIFVILNKSGLSALISVNSKSALPMFLVFGVLAGLSSCAALVGGIVLSMSKQWSEIYAKDDSTIKKLQPHILFNLGRLVSYSVLGALLGALGGILQLSLTFTSILMFAVSVMMLFLGLQMIGVKQFQRFQITTPKFITRYAVDEKNFSGRYMPFVMGGLTFFLPCGFTITAQGLALASGSVLQGGLIMLFFAIGTLPMLLMIGLSSVKFSKKPHLANRFLRVAGVLVLFFALFNINAQLNVLGWTSLDDISTGSGQGVSAKIIDDDLPPIVNGKQILKMDARASGYEPNNLKVRAGIPVRWEITDKGTSGCTNAVMSRGLFEGQISLTPGKTAVKEFTQDKPGKYKFSCWMGMVSGVIEVVDTEGNSPVTPDSEIIPSDSQGCGCGSGGGTCSG